MPKESLSLLNIPSKQKQISPVFGEGDFWILHVFLWVIFYKANTCVCVCKCVCACSVMPDSAAPWTIAYQAPLSMGFSRQEYWSGLPWPPSGDFPNPGIESKSLCLLHWQGDSLPTESSPSPCISLAISLESEHLQEDNVGNDTVKGSITVLWPSSYLCSCSRLQCGPPAASEKPGLPRKEQPSSHLSSPTNGVTRVVSVIFFHCEIKLTFGDCQIKIGTCHLPL